MNCKDCSYKKFYDMNGRPGRYYCLHDEAKFARSECEPHDIQVSAGTDVDAVVVNAAIQPVDSVEKIYMTVTVSADTSAE